MQMAEEEKKKSKPKRYGMERKGTERSVREKKKKGDPKVHFTNYNHHFAGNVVAG